VAQTGLRAWLTARLAQADLCQPGGVTLRSCITASKDDQADLRSTAPPIQHTNSLSALETSLRGRRLCFLGSLRHSAGALIDVVNAFELRFERTLRSSDLGPTPAKLRERIYDALVQPVLPRARFPISAVLSLPALPTPAKQNRSPPNTRRQSEPILHRSRRGPVREVRKTYRSNLVGRRSAICLQSNPVGASAARDPI